MPAAGSGSVAKTLPSPGPAARQMLHTTRTRLTGPVGDRPAVHPRQVRRQPAHEVLRPQPWFDPRKPRHCPAHQTLERLLPQGKVYPVSCGHYMILVCPQGSR